MDSEVSYINFNPFMHNDVKWPNFAVWTPQDF